MFRSLDFADLLHVSVNSQIGFCVMWFLIGVAGVLLEVVMTTRAGRKSTASCRPTARCGWPPCPLTPSVIVAIVLTVKFLLPVNAEVVSMLWKWNFPIPILPKAEEIQYIVPVWMMLYGTGVYTAGLFSIRPPRVLGLTVHRPGRAGLAGASRNTGWSRPRRRSACCTSFSGGTSSTNNGKG